MKRVNSKYLSEKCVLSRVVSIGLFMLKVKDEMKESNGCCSVVVCTGNGIIVQLHVCKCAKLVCV